jgi:agmatinase
MPPAPRLIGLPYDASSSFLRGAAAGPRAIRELLASAGTNHWSEPGVDTRSLADAGDFVLGEPTAARAAIEAGIADLLAADARPIALGGDHSVTYPIVRAVARALGPVAILHLDAHPDLYDEFEGDRYSHACPFARILEEGLASRLVQVGIRTANTHQREQAARFGVEVLDMRAWRAGARPALDGPVYLSIDLDGLDPAFAPGVSHREPGGLTLSEAVGLIHAVGGPIVGADVVELNPSQDPTGVTAAVAAKLVKELAGRMLQPG